MQDLGCLKLYLIFNECMLYRGLWGVEFSGLIVEYDINLYYREIF